MKLIIYATAYLNRIVKGVVSYFLRPKSKGTQGVKEVVSRIARLPFVIPPEEYANLVNTFLNECIAAAAVPVFDTGTPGKRDPPPHLKLINAV